MAGAAKQEEVMDDQRVSDGEVEKHGAKGNEKEDVFGEEKESGHEDNDPEQPSDLADATTPLRQEMDVKASEEISMIEKPSSWLEQSLDEDYQSTVSQSLYFIFPVCDVQTKHCILVRFRFLLVCTINIFLHCINYVII